MSDTIWVLLTDGYYMKLLYLSEEEGVTLRTYREADFDKSSDLTYRLITRHKKSSNELEQGSQDSDSPAYVLKLIAKFLDEKSRENSFNSLCILAPEVVQDMLEKHFSPQLIKLIKCKITGDFLNLPVDKLQILVAENILQSN